MSYDHYQLGVRESLVTQLACCDCGGEAQGNYSCDDGKSQVWHVVEGVTKAIHEVKLDGEDYRTWQRRLASVQYGRGPAVHPAKGVSVKDYT